MRIRSLDSLRGVAALIVVFYHCLLIPAAHDSPHAPLLRGGNYDLWSWFQQTPLFLLVNGSAAVLVFFVLSGLVLALTFVGRDQQQYAPYLIKRITRIWPPFAVAILFAAGLDLLVHSGVLARVSQSEKAAWLQPVTLTLVLSHLVLINGTVTELDSPMWSLVHEMRVSLIFPVIVFVVLKRPLLAVFLSTALLIPVALMHDKFGTVVNQIASTAGCLFLFVAGAAMGVRLPAVRQFVSAIPKAWLLVIWTAALAFTAFAPYANQAPGLLRLCLRMLVSGAGCIAIVALCTKESFVTRVLKGRAPSWLGRVSYSLYLIHAPILLALLHACPSWPIPFTLVLGVAVSLAVSEAFHRLFELPPAQFGRRLAARFG